VERKADDDPWSLNISQTPDKKRELAEKRTPSLQPGSRPDTQAGPGNAERNGRSLCPPKTPARERLTPGGKGHTRRGMSFTSKAVMDADTVEKKRFLVAGSQETQYRASKGAKCVKKPRKKPSWVPTVPVKTSGVDSQPSKTHEGGDRRKSRIGKKKRT